MKRIGFTVLLLALWALPAFAQFSGGTGGSGSGGSAGALLDGVNQTDTLAGTPVRGDVICANSTPKWARLARGSTGNVLFTNSSGDCEWGTVDAAPSNATFWTGSACAGCSAEHSLAAITGIVKSTAGTPSAATAGTDYTTPTSTESFQNKTIDCSATGMVCSNFPGGSTGPDPTALQITEEFCGGTGLTDSGVDTAGLAGSNAWNSKHSTSAGTGNSVAKVNSSLPHGCVWDVTSSNASGGYSMLALHDRGANVSGMLGDHTGTLPWTANFVFKCSATTSITCIAALANNSTDVIVPINYIGLRYDTNASDTNFTFVCAKSGVGTTAVDTTVAADTSWHRLKVYSTSANDIRYILYDSAGSIQKDGSAANQCSTSANIPTAELTGTFHVGTRTTATKAISVDYFSYTRTVAR